MKNHDILQRFLFDGTDIRGEITTLESSYQNIAGRQKYPKPVAHLLGEFLAAASLLSATLKFPGIVTIQARGDGPLSTLMVECAQVSNLRGIIRGDLERAEGLHSLTELMGSATLAITIEPIGGERYQGIVPMEADNLSACLEYYFQQSEQLPTKISLTANDQLAGGLLIQQMPNSADRIKGQTDWEHVSALLSTLKTEEQLDLSHNDQLYLLFHQEAIRLFEPRDIHFFCSCSKQRTANTLVSLGADETREIIEEQGVVAITCQFCDEEYRFYSDDVEDLFDDNKTTLH
jgi:molecular chaperone Hsp33